MLIPSAIIQDSKKLDPEKSTDRGVTPLTRVHIVRFRVGKRGPLPTPSNISSDMDKKSFPIGSHCPEEFFDGGAEQLLQCHAMLDQIALHDNQKITVIFDKAFLKKILRSHILHIRNIENPK